MTASLVTGALCMLFVSYLFIFQSAYDPPEDDFFSELSASIQIPSFTDAYVIKHADGTCTLVLNQTEIIQIRDPQIVSLLLNSSFRVVEE